TNQFADAVSAIPGIVHQYMDQHMKEAVREAVQIQTDRIQDSLQRENDEFLRNIDENMKKVLKGLVKNQVKEQVSRILPRIEEFVNATLEAKVLTRSSYSSRTSYAVVADLSEMELKKILIEKMEGNKYIQRSDEQRNLYKALVEAYEADKTILDTYGDSTILKRRREDDDQEGPSAGPNRGSKRQKEGDPDAPDVPRAPDAPAGGGGGGGCGGGDPEGVLVPQTNSYDHHKPGRSCLQTSVIGNFLYINDRQITKASMKWSLHCPINCISTNLINGFAHFIRNIEIL
nr:hypothetical protein [Tanacetum cinerariifolium]